MAILTLTKVQLAFGAQPLLDNVDFNLETGERVCLLGRNGMGKSTLLKVIAGMVKPDDGEVRLQRSARVGYLPQEPVLADAESVYDNVIGGLAQERALLRRYASAMAQLSAAPDTHRELHDAESALQAAGAWDAQRRTETILSQLQLPPDQAVGTLSGGWKRRVALARALVANPEVLLLDEPTNHLDIEAIAWLEDLVRTFPGAVLFVTHDRRFLQSLATRIVEIDRGRLASFNGDYANYLRRKAELLNAEAQQAALFDKRLAQEEVWIRKGIQARRTRNEGRVRALESMRNQHAQRRNLMGKAKLEVDTGLSSGRLVFEVRDLRYAYGDRVLIDGFSTDVMRGDRIGLVGPNGVGKTTLLKLLLGESIPSGGTVVRGTRLETAYFDQLREQLDPKARVVDCVGEGRETVTINGQTRHVMSYLQDFLFAPDRARSPVKSLSGGERNRLLLARLLAKPTNLLILDEPTNDLDLETLELLEDLLLEYSGTLLLVSHDRAFLDNVVTACWAFEGNGAVREYVGGYSDYLRQRPSAATVASSKPETATRAPTTPGAGGERKKLSYKAQRELETLPQQIEAWEREQVALQTRLSDSTLYATQAHAVKELQTQLQDIQAQLEQAYARWEQLEASQQS